MPYVNCKGARVWWEEHGEGEPVLAIMGLSFPLAMWHRTAPLLAERFRVILFDNRGVGRSDVPFGPYMMSRMAADAVAVLDAAGVKSAHVLGASMGGMIAQELALQFPSRVRSMILGSTWCGGIRAVRPDLRTFPDMTRFQRLSPEGKMRAFTHLLYSPETPPERIEEDIAVRLRCARSDRGTISQLLGTLVWNSWGRLPRIKQPVKIVHGELDRLIPVANARVLAARIPNARLSIIPGAGHVFTTDQPQISNQQALDFLAEMTNGQDALGLLA